MFFRRLLPLALLLGSFGLAWSAEVHAGVARQLPPGFVVLGSATTSFGRHAFTIVALGKRGEPTLPEHRPPHPAAARPLLLFARLPNGTVRQVGRNDHVILRADDGGPCDPFLDSGAMIEVKGRMITVENGVACGQHWTDQVTFRFDDTLGRFVFDNHRHESWMLNPDSSPGADAMVRDVPSWQRQGSRTHPKSFDRWWPAR